MFHCMHFKVEEEPMEMVLQVKSFAHKPNDLSSIPKSHGEGKEIAPASCKVMVEGKRLLLQVVL